MVDVCAGFIEKEYFELLKIVAQFDDRFLAVKGWTVTFSLATLALAFQKKTKGLFLVAALSAMSFWVLEAYMKLHQNQYYPRMRQIEVVCNSQQKNAPAVDWAWQEGRKLLDGESEPIPGPITQERKPTLLVSVFGLHMGTMLLPHVLLPHGVTVVIGLALYFRRREESAGGGGKPTAHPTASSADG